MFLHSSSIDLTQTHIVQEQEQQAAKHSLAFTTIYVRMVWYEMDGLAMPLYVPTTNAVPETG